jgi:hypothetical protein
MFVPDSARSPVLELAHSSRLILSDPGFRPTTLLVAFHGAGCFHSKLRLAFFNHSLFLIAPGPIYPWTLLPGSPRQMATTILMVVDRFSKAAHHIPFPKLPSAKEMAGLRSWSPVLVPGVLHPNWVVSQPVLWFPPPDLTASRSEPIRPWRQPFVALSPPTTPPGASNLCGWNMPITPAVAPHPPYPSYVSCVQDKTCVSLSFVFCFQFSRF